MKTGKTFIISGPSGVGKSTVLRELLRDRDDLYFSISATTRTPREGEINGVHYHFINGDRFREMIQEDEFLEYAEYVGNFYGTPKRYVDESMAQGKDVILDIEVHGALQCIGKPKGVIRSQVPEVLRLVGLADQMDSLPDQLSGGEQQRVAVARAMVNRPPLLICDEPTGNLDPAISLGIMKLLERINRTGTTVIVATHDREMVDSMHRRVIALEGGHVIRDQERGGYGNYGTN